MSGTRPQSALLRHRRAAPLAQIHFSRQGSVVIDPQFFQRFLDVGMALGIIAQVGQGRPPAGSHDPPVRQSYMSIHNKSSLTFMYIYVKGTVL
ncbi:MAG TPA: hypothetical protein VN379_21045 [Sporomusa sp.]|nr:hypothetical protein [Sporomusa sp.]